MNARPDHRSLPHNNDAERAVLGCLMNDPEQLSAVREIMTAEDMYRANHKRLFALICRMCDSGKLADMTTVVHQVLQENTRDDMGGLAYISSLPDDVPSSANTTYYAELVRSTSLRRQLVIAGRQIAEQGMHSSDDIPELMQSVDSLLMRVTEADTGGGGLVHNSETGDDELEQIFIDADTRGSGGTVGLPLFLGGMAEFLYGDVSILAARPAMGKTAKMLGESVSVASTGIGVGIFSFEMPAARLKRRQCSILTGVNLRERLKDADREALREAWRYLSSLPIYVDDQPGLNHQQIRARIRATLRKDPNVKLIIIDYIGLCGGIGRQTDYDRVTEFSKQMKIYAKEFNIHIRCLSQLNRGCEGRTNKRPLISDLRDSGAIEQDADIIQFIYNDAKYDEDSEFNGFAELLTLKQREGVTGTRMMSWDPTCLTFGIASDQQGWLKRVSQSIQANKPSRGR